MALDYQVRPIVTWPGKRTVSRKSSPFRSHWADTEKLLAVELRHLDARQVVIQLNVQERDIRMDGCLRGDARPSGPQVILTFGTPQGPMQFPCDAFDEWRDNVRAIALGLEALRKLNRYGITQRGEQYTGWKALPPPGDSSPSGSPPSPAEFRTRDDAMAFLRTIVGGRADRFPIDQVLRECEMHTHPDRGGKPEYFKRVQAARMVLLA